jgi:hypothetical protein
LKREKPKIWENEIVLIKLTVVRTTFSQNSLRIEVDNKREWAVSTMCLCFLLATPFYLKAYVHKVWWMIPSKSHLKYLKTVEYWVLTRARKAVYISKNSEWIFI